LASVEQPTRRLLPVPGRGDPPSREVGHARGGQRPATARPVLLDPKLPAVAPLGAQPALGELRPAARTQLHGAVVVPVVDLADPEDDALVEQREPEPRRSRPR
jgi:hypothetical protein